MAGRATYSAACTIILLFFNFAATKVSVTCFSSIVHWFLSLNVVLGLLYEVKEYSGLIREKKYNALCGNHVHQSVRLYVCLWSSMSEHTVCRIWMKFGIAVLYKTSSSKREFRENRLSDSHTLRKGENEFLPVLSVFLNRLWWNSV